MMRYLSSAILVGVLAVPVAVLAQHSQGADTPSGGTAASCSRPAPRPPAVHVDQRQLAPYI